MLATAANHGACCKKSSVPDSENTGGLESVLGEKEYAKNDGGITRVSSYDAALVLLDIGIKYGPGSTKDIHDVEPTSPSQ
jgi:hypothetical protein